MAIPEGLLTVEQARVRLGLSRQKMAAFLKDGTIPFVRFRLDRRKKYIRIEDADRVARELTTPMRDTPNDTTDPGGSEGHEGNGLPAAAA